MAWMSDEEFIYRQDIKEKKAAGRGAFHKKGGSKSKKCKFPSDYMTKKEKQALNGEVMSYNPNKWYSWDEFTKLPNEYQTKYVNSIMTRFNCSFSAVAEVVFGKRSTQLYTFLKRRDSLQYINMPNPNIGKTLLPGKKKLKEAMEKDLWPNRDEIQNESRTGDGEDMSSEEAAEPTLEEKVAEAIDTVTLLASNNIPMPPEKIDEVFIEKTGMTREDAEKAIGLEWDNPGEPVGNPEYVETTEDSTDVQSFSIIMDHIDLGIIQYVSDLFKGKKISVSFEVKEAL